MSPPVAALIATKDRAQLLLTRAFPSVLQQSCRPDMLVIVNDGAPLGAQVMDALSAGARDAGVALKLLTNTRAEGAGGAWNTGLDALGTLGYQGFVAILDDDDAWARAHIATNLKHAESANLVVSGLELHVAGRRRARPLIEHLDAREFLVGNPGWQGSNTFVDLDLLLSAGGFREGLVSLNDRDLAIRVLRHPTTRWRLTGEWTAIWYADTPGNLSSPRSTAKLDGLRAFWRIYGGEMRATEREAFFQRAERLFCFRADDITHWPPAPIPPLGFGERTSNG